MADPLPKDVPVATVLSAAAAELDLATFDLARIEEAIVAVLSQQKGETDTETLRAIQAIDVLNQSLSALAAFLDLAGRDASDTSRIDPSLALGTVRMKAMLERLIARLSGESAPATTFAAHETDLFDDFGT